VSTDRTPPRFPKFASVEDERRHRKQRLAAAFRVFGRLGYDEGVAGHITARDPGLTDHFWVNPLGMSFRQIRVRDLLLVDHNGVVVEGDWPLNGAAFAIHSRIHAARPDVVAAAHAHSMAGKTWSTFRRPLDPLTQDACAFYDDHAVFDDFSGVVYDLDEGERIAAALGDRKAAILANHGLLTVGRSVDEAAWWFVAMDRACEVQLRAEQTGTPVPIGPDVAARTARQVGNPGAGWWGFQALYQEVVADQPDLLEE
jgi:ribulose-5-phosphate 4-epimerase/fuculose-1-phosphate aldolase